MSCADTVLFFPPASAKVMPKGFSYSSLSLASVILASVKHFETGSVKEWCCNGTTGAVFAYVSLIKGID